jgi:hypothetical protein
VYDPNAKRPRRSVFPDGASSKKQKNWRNAETLTLRRWL